MGTFLIFAYLFFIGSISGWVLEVLYRNFPRNHKKWVNPGFCTGPYLPIYGFGLCILYILASLEQYNFIPYTLWNKLFLFLVMAASMTAIEYIAGLFCLKHLKVRLWDYSSQRGNIQGIICPLFSFYWAVLGAAYFFLIHTHILDALAWFSRNLTFSFIIGMFFGIFLIDVFHSGNLMARLKQFANENNVVVRYESLKDYILTSHETTKARYHFFRPFQEIRPLREILKEMLVEAEKRKK